MSVFSPISYILVAADPIRQYRSVAESRRVESSQIDAESGLCPVQDGADVIDIDWGTITAAAIASVEGNPLGF